MTVSSTEPIKPTKWTSIDCRHNVRRIRGVKTVEGNDESLYCHDNLIIPLIKRGMMSDYAHVNHASVSVHNH